MQLFLLVFIPAILAVGAMPPCERCGEGTRRGRGRGWCSNLVCRKVEQEEKEEAGGAALPPCDRCGGKKRGRKEGYCDNKACRDAKKEEEKAAKQARKEERAEKAAAQQARKEERAGKSAAKQARKEERTEKDAGERGPFQGEGAGGRPMDSEETRAKKEEVRLGLACFGDKDFEEVEKEYKKFLGKWGRFGLSKACEECRTLTPGKHYSRSKATKKLACKNCREKKTKYALPTLSPIPAPLAALTSLEKRLLAMAKVNQVLIDKLPAGGPSAQWGRMYVAPMDQPCLCNVLDGAELGEDGQVYVNGVQGMMSSTARLQHLQAALETLQAHHAAYKESPAVEKALADMTRILAHVPAAPPRPDDEEPEDGEQNMEVTYLLPRDPAIPKADRSDLQELRRKAMHTGVTIDAVLFPHLFPDGQGGYDPDAHQKFVEYARKRLLGQDGRFEADAAYIMWLLEERMKKRLSGNVNVRMKNQLTPKRGERFADFSHQIFTALRDLPGTQPYLFSKRGVALGMYEQLGKPQFFLTLTCHARQPNILAAVITAKLIRMHGLAEPSEVAEVLHNYQRDENHKWHDMTATQLCNSMPAILARQFIHGLRQLLHWLGAPDFATEEADEQDRPGGDDRKKSKHTSGEDEEYEAAPAMDQEGRFHKVKQDRRPFEIFDYIVRIEWQKRGYPHAHILLWADVPDVSGKKRPERTTASEEGYEDEDQVVVWSDEDVCASIVPTSAEDLSDKYISTKSANRWMKDERVEPERRGVMAKLATMVEHSCGPYCGKYTLGACRFGFPRAAEKQTRWRTPQEQFASRWKASLAARRHEDDGFVGQYNKAILRQWRASMDLQVVCELNCASKYILGYCFKSEEDLTAKKRVDDILQTFLQDAGRQDLSNNEVYRAAHAATQGRTTSTFEAVHYILGYPAVWFSRDNVWLQVGPPSTWTLSVPQADEEQALQDPVAYKAKRQEAGQNAPAAQRWYQQLQQHFPDVEIMVPVEGGAPIAKPWSAITFFDFAAGFKFTGGIFNPDNVSARKRPAIVGHRNYSPDLQPEEFYYSKMLLYLRWVKPGDWLTEADCGSHAAAFHRIATDRDQHPTFLQSVCFPKLDGTVQAARELQAVQAVMFLKAKLDNVTWTHTRAEEDNYQDSIRIMQALKERHGDDIDFLVPGNVPTGPAMDIFAPVEGGEAG